MGLHIRGRTNHICKIGAKELGRARRRPINNSAVDACTLLQPFSTNETLTYVGLAKRWRKTVLPPATFELVQGSEAIAPRLA